MRRSITAALLAVFLILVTALPALAEVHGKWCHTYNDGAGHSAGTCIEVNQHGQFRWLQGLADYADGPGDYNCIWIDYVKLYKNGNVSKTINGAAGCVYGYWDILAEQTDWQTNCVAGATYTGEVRFKIKWSASSSSTWKVDASFNYVPNAGDCAV